MRGDSLRDLYAKTLALVGLGVLAGVGALFDYWPAGIRLVPAAPALELPELASSFKNPDFAVEDVAAKTHRPAMRVNVARLESSARPDLVLASSPQFATPALSALPAESVAAPSQSLPLPIATLAEHSAPVEDPGRAQLPALTTISFEEAMSQQGAGWHAPVSLSDSSAGVDDGSFLSDALRKTRTSLVRTGARTGASIVDAVRVVGGAVRRALPN